MHFDSKILITGSRGFIGTNLCLYLKKLGYNNLIYLDSKKCDLKDKNKTFEFFERHQPEYVFHLAAYVKGIMGNLDNKGISYYNNILINTHTVEAARLVKIKKILCMGTGAIYPANDTASVLTENMIWQGKPHLTEDAYAYSKRSMLSQLYAYKESYALNFSYVVSGNLYGPHDNFDTKHGHVVPSLIKKFYYAKQNNTDVEIWGNGTAERDFLYASDCARALYSIMLGSRKVINMGSGKVYNIKSLVKILQDISGVNEVLWDKTKPNGDKCRKYNLTKLHSLGFKSEVSLEEGLRRTFEWFGQNELIIT